MKCPLQSSSTVPRLCTAGLGRENDAKRLAFIGIVMMIGVI